MASNEKAPYFQILMLITTPKLADKAAGLFQKGAVPIQYRFNAEGTASSSIMETLGLGSIDKRVLASVMPKPFTDAMLRKLQTELKMGTVNSGIGFTIPLTGANAFMLQMMTQTHDAAPFKSSLPERERKDDAALTEMKYSVIAAIVNRGFSGDVMEHARAAGAGGGTVIHSRQIGNKKAASFWGVELQDEKDIVLILSDAESKMDIMRAISENCGMQSEAKGLVLSMPIDTVIGFQSK